MSNTGAIPALFVLLRGGSEADQVESLHVLLATDDRDALTGILKQYHYLGSALRDELECYAERFLPVLTDLIHSEDEQLRFNCVEFLSRPSAGATIHLLGCYVGDPNPQIAELAMSAIESAVANFIAPKDNELRDESCDAYAACRSVCDSKGEGTEHHTKLTGLANALDEALNAGAKIHGRKIFNLLSRLGRCGDAVLLNALRSPRKRRGYDLVMRELEGAPRPPTVLMALSLMAIGSAPLRRLAQDVLAKCEVEKHKPSLIAALRIAGPENSARIVKRFKIIPWLRLIAAELEQVGEDNVAAWVDALNESGSDIARKLIQLKQCLEIRSEKVTQKVFDGLNRHYTSLVRPLLVELCGHSFEPIRYHAVAALSRTNFDGKLSLLENQLGSDSARIRVLAASTIVTDQFDDFFSRFDNLTEERRRESAKLVRQLDSRLHDKLAERLASRDVEERLKAIRILSYTGVDERLEEELIKIAQDSNSRVRACAPFVLGRLHSSGAAKSLLWLLKDFDVRVRANAVEGVELLGRSQLGKVLVPFLGSAVPRLRANAAKALYILGSANAQRILDAMAQARQPEMRLAAVWALANICEDTTVERALEATYREHNQILQRRMMGFIELAQGLRMQKEQKEQDEISCRLRIVA